MNVSATSDWSSGAVRTFSIASSRKPTQIGLNRKECSLASGRAESLCLKDVSRNLTLSFPGFSSFVFAPFSSRLPLNDVKAISGSSSFTFYRLSIPVERQHSYYQYFHQKKNHRAKILWLLLAQLGSHVHPWANPSGQNNTVLLLVRTGSCLPLKPRHGQAHLEPQGSRETGAFSQRSIQILIPDNGGRGTERVDGGQAKPMNVLGTFSLNYLQQARCYQAEKLYKHNLDICLDIWGLKCDLYWLQHFGNGFLQIALTHMTWSLGGFLSIFLSFLFFLILGSSL